MRNTLAFVLVASLVSVAPAALAVTQQAKPAGESSSIDENIQAMRADLQHERSDIIAKNVSLGAAEAAKFWPLYESYQKEQNAIMDDQLKGIRRYVDSYETLDDAGALSLMKANFERDDRMNALRKKWLNQFQKIVGTKTAVRVMQIDRQLSMAHQLAFATRIPLVR